jgi:hypothetical protein
MKESKDRPTQVNNGIIVVPVILVEFAMADAPKPRRLMPGKADLAPEPEKEFEKCFAEKMLSGGEYL